MARRRRPPPQASDTTLWVLLALNALVYVGWQVGIRSGEDGFFANLMLANFMVSSEAVLAGRVWTLLTSAFSHIDPIHLFVNMLALWVFGRDVLRVSGNAGFVQLYLVGGLIASIGHVAFSLLTGEGNPAVGASGSVMAVAVVFAALFPRRILLLNFFIPVPAALAVAGYIVLDVVGAFGGVAGNIAHAAHLGGALYGLIYWAVVARPRWRRMRSELGL